MGTIPHESLVTQAEDMVFFAPPGQAISTRKPHPRVLLADDGVHHQQVIAYFLTEAGAEVTLADNGQVACQATIAAMARGEPFDAILMDMQMPVMNGYAASTAIRAAGFHGPIIAVTAGMPNQRERCLDFGCSASLTKPIDRELLIHTVATALAGGERKTASTARKPHISMPSKLQSTAIADLDIAPFLPTFIADLPGIVGRISALLDAGNVAELAATIHQIKGTGGLYGFEPLTQAAIRAETALIESSQIAAFATEVESLIALIRDVEGYESSRELQSIKGEA